MATLIEWSSLQNSVSICTPKKFYEIDLRLDKHSSLLQTLVNYGCKMLYIWPWFHCYKTFHGSKSRIFIISLSNRPLQVFPGWYSVYK
jgi:hypothetical protein